MTTIKHLKMIHKKCRNSSYPRCVNVNRFPVPDEMVSWNLLWNEYKPPLYESNTLKNKQWADPDISDSNFKPKWNSIDGSVNRISHIGQYNILETYPLNPMGRTGLIGRGVLGRWGPNHAADPIVTKWKTSAGVEPVLDKISMKPILQFVAIKRRDSGEWAIPGGMVDPGELITSTLKREFLEEAFNSLEKKDSEMNVIKSKIELFFNTGEEIYKGYVDDPRNTDNAWMETVAMQFHDEKGDIIAKLPLCAGDDAVGVKWMDLSRDLPLYASHSDLISKVAAKMKCHW